MTLTVLYFAQVRERIGESREEIATDAPTVAALLDELAAKDPRYAAAFADRAALRAALDQEMVDLDAPLGAARELAVFPPMTGG